MDFVWEYANPAATTLLRRPVAGLIGHRLLSVLPGNQTNSLLFTEYVQVAETGVPLDRELYYHADGIDGWFWNKTVKVGDGVANFFSDVTARKRLEELERKRAAETLQASEDRFQSAFASAPMGMALLTPEGHWVEVNLALCAMLGYTEHQLRTTTFQALTHPDDLAGDLANVEQLLAGRLSSYQREKRYLHRSGRIVWALVNVSVMRDPQQHVQYLLAQILDITARKQAEADLRAQQKLFRSFMDNSPAVAYIKDEAGRYTYMNQPLIAYAQRETGEAEWQGKTDVDLWSARAEQLRRNDQAALQAERTLVVEETTAHGEREQTWLSFKFPLRLDSGQRFLAGMSVDITDRKRAEAWLESLIDATQDAVISIDRQARIVRFNPAAEKIFGYAKDEVVGHKVNMLMAEPYATEHDEYIARYEATGVPQAIGRIRTVMAQRKNKELFPMELSVTVIAMDEDIHYAAFIRDISDRMRLQGRLLEQERLAAIGTTAAKLAHEIGNPLNGMAMSVQMLERRLASTASDEKIVERVHAFRQQITRLTQLLNEFRSLSRRQQFDLQPTNIAAVAASVLENQAAHYRSKGVRVAHDFPGDLPQVMGDSSKLIQVLVNLCKNAVEAMPEGGTLTVRGTNSGGQVTIEVSDTGTGIREDVDIFEPFITTKPEGSGLGLPIVRQIIAGHGGSLTYRSEAGKGTTFSISLPVRSAAQ